MVEFWWESDFVVLSVPGPDWSVIRDIGKWPIDWSVVIAVYNFGKEKH